MDLTEIILGILSIIILIPTIASITKFDQWWIRGFDFPRIQIIFLIIIIFLLDASLLDYEKVWHIVLTILVGASFIYQGIQVYPYTYLASKEVVEFKGNNPDNLISILVSNVLTPNQHYSKLIDRVNKHQPDLLLTLETDGTWEKELEVLEKDYPYTVKIPKDNLYGMHLYSKLELKDIRVKYLISDEIPSIHGYVCMKNGENIKIHCLHPKPPSPTEDDTSTNRDAELLLVGKDLEVDKESVLVFGDLNDVAWSRTTRLFQKISGLLDPRIGRGFFNTFNANYFLLRWPLDHVFHSNDFTLVEIERVEKIGSDHFPMFIKLNYEPRAEILQSNPEKADEEEEKWAEEKIEEGHPKDRDI